MPRFDLVSREEAARKAATTGKRAQVLREYLGYIEQLSEGRAGRLQAGEGETLVAVRRRLGAAAKLVNKELVIRRTGEELYFWTPSMAGASPRRPRGRRPEARSGS